MGAPSIQESIVASPTTTGGRTTGSAAGLLSTFSARFRVESRPGFGFKTTRLSESLKASLLEF